MAKCHKLGVRSWKFFMKVYVLVDSKPLFKKAIVVLMYLSRRRPQ